MNNSIVLSYPTKHEFFFFFFSLDFQGKKKREKTNQYALIIGPSLSLKLNALWWANCVECIIAELEAKTHIPFCFFG